MRYNPFQPNRIVAPGMFQGRAEELQTIEQCLFQAKNSNPQHFLLIGERGIGKSSMFLFVEALASGAIKTFSGASLHFVTVSIDLGGCHSQLDVVRAIGRGLKQALRDHQAAKEAAKRLWDWLTHWEVLGVRFHQTDDEIDPQDAADELVAGIEDFCRDGHGFIDGLLILVDEADRPETGAGVGELFKLFTERLTKRDCNNVLIGMAGLPTVLAKLRESHESAPRLFETLFLKPLEVDERKNIVRTGITQANDKNGYDITIESAALDLIAELSEGYPHFVQQFAYSAFDESEDRRIDANDVVNGAYKENGALAQLGRKYFDELYYSRIGSDEYRKVLNTMAEHSDDWVPRRTLIAESGVKATTMNNALLALKARNIILVDESRQGFYRLPTKSFAAWINAIKSVAERTEGDPVPQLAD